MNKSLIFKNKFYLFISFLFTFLFFLYLLYFLINGQRGILKFYQLKSENTEYQNTLEYLFNKNHILNERISRLQTSTLDFDYLEEKLRENTGFTKKNEIVIIFN